MIWPLELKFSASKRVLEIAFEGGEVFTLPYKYLREESPSAENKGHGSGPPPPRAPIADDIMITKAEPIGRYAVQLVFSDGHDSGYYRWDLLHELGQRAA